MKLSLFCVFSVATGMFLGTVTADSDTAAIGNARTTFKTHRVLVKSLRLG